MAEGRGGKDQKRPVGKEKTNAPGTDRSTTEGQMAACCLAYGDPIGQKTHRITQAQNGPIDPPTPDPFKTLQDRSGEA